MGDTLQWPIPHNKKILKLVMVGPISLKGSGSFL